MPREILSNNFKIKFGDSNTGNDQETFLRYYSWVMDPQSWNADGYIKTVPTTNNTGGKLVQTPFMDWHYWPEKMWNIILRELILDTETVVQSHVRLTAMVLGADKYKNTKRLIEEAQKAQKDNSGFLFNALPGSIHGRCRLSCNKGLWIKVNVFYAEIRNNFMHSKQITNVSKEVIQEIFTLYREIYIWIESISIDPFSNCPLSNNSILFDCFPGMWEKDVGQNNQEQNNF